MPPRAHAHVGTPPCAHPIGGAQSLRPPITTLTPRRSAAPPAPGLATAWTVAFDVFVAPHAAVTSLGEFAGFLRDGMQCFVGQPVEAYCAGDPYLVFAFFIVFNLAFNQLMLYVFKHGSAVLGTVASARGAFTRV